MNIIVCIKQVPDTTEVKLDPVTNTLIRDGVPSIINPDDKAGIEAALSIKDTYGAHVTVVSMGPATSAARGAHGCDEAVQPDRAWRRGHRPRWRAEKDEVRLSSAAARPSTATRRRSARSLPNGSASRKSATSRT